MNHLAHLALSDGDEALMVGNFLGDFVKGRLKGEYPADIERGIRLHRAIDAYADRHPLVRQGGKRLDTAFTRYAGIMLDIAFDHFLATHWERFYAEPLCQFSRAALGTLVANAQHLPEPAATTARRMHSRNTLAHYTETAFVANAYRHVGTRLTRPSPMNDAAEEFLRHRRDLEQDFLAFYPELRNFARDWVREHPL